MLPWFRSTAWLLAGARTVTLTAPAELLLLHRDADPRPAVRATVEERGVAVVVDPFGPSRVGRIAAIRLGLADDRSMVTFDATLGPLVLEDVRAKVVDGDEVVIGLAALPELAVHLDPAEGVLRLWRASDVDRLGPLPTSLPQNDGRRRWPDGVLSGAVLDAAARTSKAAVSGAWRGGRYRGTSSGLDPRHVLPVEPGGPQRLGGDALATLDLRCGPGAATCRVEPALTHWTSDPLTVTERRLEALVAHQERATAWEVPERPPDDISVPSGQGGSSWRMRRWLELSDVAWAAGDMDAALWAADVASRHAGDLCEAWMIRGERVLRAAPAEGHASTGAQAAMPFLARAVEHLGLHEQDVAGYALPQAESCRGAAGVLDEARLADGAGADAMGTPVVRAVALLEAGAPAQADVALRAHMADGAEATATSLAVHALVQLALHRPGPARAAIERLAEDPDGDTLWGATIALQVLAELDGAEAAIATLRTAGAGPAWQAVADRAAGAPRPEGGLGLGLGVPEGAQHPLARQVAIRLARSPGDPTGWALAAWLGVDPPRAAPSLDGAIAAGWLGAPDAEAQLAAWPLAAHVLAMVSVSTAEPEAEPEADMDPQPFVEGPAPSRTTNPEDGVVSPEPSLQEPDMIPIIAVAAVAADFDHTHATFGQFLDGAVSQAGVDYGALAARRDTLDAYLNQVAAADASSFDNSQKIALYVNAYNAYTLQTMLDAGPEVSIRDLDGGKVWDTRTFPVAGAEMTLNQMEHGHARKLADGRIHAAVNCASKGCPPLPPSPLTGSGMDAQLHTAAKRWADTNAYVLTGDTIALSKIFDWYGDDFANVKGERDLPGVGGKAEQAIWFLVDYVDEPTKAKLLSGEITATWGEYDWSRNSK